MRIGAPQIDRITVWEIDLPMRRSFASASVDLATRRLAIIKLEAGGVIGWGEAAPVAGHTADFPTVWTGLAAAGRAGAPTVASISPGIAGAAYEQAMTDVAAKLQDRPLWQHLGATEPVPASAAIGLDADHQPDRSAIAAAAASGYRHMKLKIDAHTDIDLLRREMARQPEVSFGADANQSLAGCSRAHLMAIDELGFRYLEQPGKATDLDWHRSLRAELATPIALDESATSPEDIEAIIAAGAADIITLKAGRFGTRTTLRLAEHIVRQELQVRLGGLLESGIGRSHSVALAGRVEFSVVGDVAASGLYFDTDLVNPPWRLRDGILELPGGPGIGVEVDEAILARLAFDYLQTG